MRNPSYPITPVKGETGLETNSGQRQQPQTHTLNQPTNPPLVTDNWSARERRGSSNLFYYSFSSLPFLLLPCVRQLHQQPVVLSNKPNLHPFVPRAGNSASFIRRITSLPLLRIRIFKRDQRSATKSPCVNLLRSTLLRKTLLPLIFTWTTFRRAILASLQHYTTVSIYIPQSIRNGPHSQFSCSRLRR